MATYASIAHDQLLANTSAMVLLKTIEASSDATISFVDGSDGVTFDSTYKEYIFRFRAVHPSHEYYSLAFNASDDASSHSYDITKTTTFFNCIHQEDDSPTSLSYNGNHDIAQGTGFQNLYINAGNGNDENTSGYLHIFNPASTTFAKQFYSRCSGSEFDDHVQDVFTAGYFNTTSALTAIQFKYTSNNIDAGTFQLFGVH